MASSHTPGENIKAKILKTCANQGVLCLFSGTLAARSCSPSERSTCILPLKTNVGFILQESGCEKMGGMVTKQQRQKQGSLPLACSSLIEDDANPWVLERLSGEMVYRNFRPDLTRMPVECKVVSVSKGFSVAVTRSRLVTAAWGRPQLHLSFSDTRVWHRHIRIAVQSNATSTVFSLTADAQLFDPHYRGEIEVRWHTHEASEVYRRIQEGLVLYNQQARTRRNRTAVQGGGAQASLMDSSLSGRTACTDNEDDDHEDFDDKDDFVVPREIIQQSTISLRSAGRR
jgi:hypothetical protein